MVPTLHGFHEPAKKLFFLNVENQYNRVANSFILLSKDIKNIPPVRIIKAQGKRRRENLVALISVMALVSRGQRGGAPFLSSIQVSLSLYWMAAASCVLIQKMT